MLYLQAFYQYTIVSSFDHMCTTVHHRVPAAGSYSRAVSVGIAGDLFSFVQQTYHYQLVDACTLTPE